jgi:hypothetical protein
MANLMSRDEGNKLKREVAELIQERGWLRGQTVSGETLLSITWKLIDTVIDLSEVVQDLRQQLGGLSDVVADIPKRPDVRK